MQKYLAWAGTNGRLRCLLVVMPISNRDRVGSALRLDKMGVPMSARHRNGLLAGPAPARPAYSALWRTRRGETSPNYWDNLEIMRENIPVTLSQHLHCHTCR